MIPVKWNDQGIEEVTTSNDNTWYEYLATTRNTDNLNSHWANAKNKNRDYFVWIPRYAYRITYYEDETCKKITGYCDGRGFVDVNGNLKKDSPDDKKFELDEGIQTVDYSNNSYIVHPAFVNGTNNDYSNGEWKEDITGIWVGKYMTSGSTSDMKVIKGVSSIGNVTIGNSYSSALKYDKEKESHLLKNSEWGAVAYLAHSKYGRNGNEISANGNYVTGSGGIKSSTTGNMFGIFDLSGNRYDYIAAFDTKSSNLSYGNSFAKKDNISTPYATAYENGTTRTNGDIIYTVSKIGDAIKEVYKGTSSKSWFLNDAFVMNKSQAFLERGANYGSTKNGIFTSSIENGEADVYHRI